MEIKYCRSELAREKPENARSYQTARVIVGDFREQARSYRGDKQQGGESSSAPCVSAYSCGSSSSAAASSGCSSTPSSASPITCPSSAIPSSPSSSSPSTSDGSWTRSRPTSVSSLASLIKVTPWVLRPR